MRTQSVAEPMFPIPAVYLIHGKGDSTECACETSLCAGQGTALARIEFYSALTYLSYDARSPADVAVKELLRTPIPEGSLLIGVGLGGLVAARLQELGRQDLQVIAICSPTWADEVTLESGAERRLAFYSSQDPIIGPRIANWPKLASFSQDLVWLDQETDQHLKYIARLFDWYVEGTLPEWIHNIRKTRR